MTYQPRTYHDPDRTTWRCTVDDELWPCPEKRAVLLELYGHRRREELGSVLGKYYVEMLDSLDGNPVEVFERTLGWLPRRRVPLVP